jgi:hypothetical protein
LLLLLENYAYAEPEIIVKPAAGSDRVIVYLESANIDLAV